jgi:hypothetical protein
VVRHRATDIEAGRDGPHPQGRSSRTYNPFSEPVVFLAILSPAHAAPPDVVDVSAESPWAGLRESSGCPLVSCGLSMNQPLEEVVFSS